MTSVLVECENNFGIITLNNQSIHNALKSEDVQTIRTALRRWKNSKLDAILITGNGKSFCSGLYLDEFDHRTWDKNPVSLICEDIENCECPVVCALNGGAYGGAVEIALSCDFRVANDKLSLMVPAASLGIHYEPSGLRRCINILGPSITRRLFLLEEMISFKDIIKTQFVDFWVEENQTTIEVAKILFNSVRGRSRTAVAGMKKTITDILNDSLDVEAADQRIKKCFNSFEHLEALSGKRKK